MDISSCTWTAKETGCHSDKNPLRVYFTRLFSPQVCILSTHCIFLCVCCSLSLYLAAFTIPCLSACHSLLSVCFFVFTPLLSGVLLFLLMSSFVPIFFLFLFLSLSFRPSLWSSPLVQPSREGEAEEGKEC